MGGQRIAYLFCKAEAVSWSELFMTVTQQDWEGNIVGEGPREMAVLWRGPLARLNSGLTDKLFSEEKLCALYKTREGHYSDRENETIVLHAGI